MDTQTNRDEINRLWMELLHYLDKPSVSNFNYKLCWLYWSDWKEGYTTWDTIQVRYNG